MINTVREFWDRQPCDLGNSTEQPGTAKYFEELAIERYASQTHIAEFADFDAWAGSRVLEIGCGIGVDSVRFAQSGASVTALDISSNSVALARQNSELHGLSDRMIFKVGDAENLSECVAQEPYDLIYSFGMLHHTPNPERVINQLAPYVHDKTIIKILVYYRFSWAVAWMILHHGKGQFWRVRHLIPEFSESQRGCPITNTYSLRTIRRSLEPNFEVTQAKIEHLFPRTGFQRLPHPWFRWVENHFGWHLCITAKRRTR